MKTEDWIVMLSSGPDIRVAARPFSAIVFPSLAGLIVCVLLTLALLGVRPDFVQALATQAFWLKVVFSATLAWTGWLAAKRLAVPGARTSILPVLLAVPVLVLWVVAGTVLWQASPEVRMTLFWGSTWRNCPLLITLLALPLLVSALRMLRDLAPTRLRLAGAVAGFAAGASAAMVYCLHCPEMSPVFVGFWYVIGMLIPSAIGAVVGPRALDW
ncbi:NrsF family protein [Pseudoduganella sp. UC29_106]|uniref:NrsF family protein n=1 Tax=Pseudoduganella sp. UC29_106 TaxID=3374553 RepID=UPI0037570154